MLLKTCWVSTLVLIGCTSHLEKYTQNEVPSHSAGNQITGGNVTKVERLRDKVYQVKAGREKLLAALVDTLMENYNITLLDSKAGILTTEWDTFYMGDRVYRNKISIFLKNSGWGQSEIKFSNNVEVLSTTGESSGKVWLPADDRGAEEKRVTLLLEEVLNNKILPPTKPSPG